MHSQTSWYMGYIAENVRRFFHPAAIDEMLATFLPMMNGTSLNVSAVWRLVSHAVDTPYVEHPRLAILHVDFLAPLTPSIIPPYALSHLAVCQLIHVRRPHVAVSRPTSGDARRPHCK